MQKSLSQTCTVNIYVCHFSTEKVKQKEWWKITLDLIGEYYSKSRLNVMFFMRKKIQLAKFVEL